MHTKTREEEEEERKKKKKKILRKRYDGSHNDRTKK
jgi:hypothetical protein